MISEIDFTNIEESDTFQYANKLEFFKNNKKIEFKPGLNIIFAPNGTGKSTLLQIMAKFTASEQGGVSTITDYWQREINKKGINALEGLVVKHDGQAVMYNNPRSAVGLVGGMAGFDNDFFEEGIFEASRHESTGLTTLGRMNKIIAVLNGKMEMPSKIDSKTSMNSDAKDILKASIEPGQQTILLDEPESGLAIHVQQKLWQMIENGAIDKNLQIIIATHSPFALLCNANFIELQPGYIHVAKECIKYAGQMMDLQEKADELRNRIACEEAGIKYEAPKPRKKP